MTPPFVALSIAAAGLLLPAAGGADPCRPLRLALEWRATALPAACAPAVVREAARIWRALGVDLQSCSSGAT